MNSYSFVYKKSRLIKNYVKDTEDIREYKKKKFVKNSKFTRVVRTKRKRVV